MPKKLTLLPRIPKLGRLSAPRDPLLLHHWELAERLGECGELPRFLGPALGLRDQKSLCSFCLGGAVYWFEAG